MKDRLKNIVMPYLNGEKNIRSLANIRYEIKKDKELNDVFNELKLKTIAEKCYFILNDLKEIPLCENCKINHKRFKGLLYGYDETCSKRCKNFLIYGVENPSKSKKVKEKIKKTNLKKYGGNAPICSEQIRNKIKKTNFEKYGYESFSSTKEYKEKCKKTYTEKCGEEHYMKTKEGKQKIKKYYQDNFGVNCASQLPDVKRKMKKTRFKNIEQTTIKIAKSRRLNFLNKIKTLYEDKFEFLFTFDDYIGVRDHKNKQTDYVRYKFKCKRCNLIFESPIVNFSYGLNCPTCDFCQSKPQLDIFTFIKSIIKNDIVLMNDRKILNGLELDIVIPSKKIAFEFNGLHWHSELNGTDKKYHLNKTKLCKEKGIQLIHIFEDSWSFKSKIVKSRIRNLLKKNQWKIGARKCQIKEINTSLKNKFLEKYHIQGKDNSSVKIGLFYKERLISVMTFCKARFNKSFEWELSRFCTINNFTIYGAAGKMLSYFIKKYNPQSIITYADRCWSNGNLYENIGFNYSHTSQPNYWYIEKGKRVSRIKFQKHKLLKLVENFDPNKTEWENMQQNGYDRIWDCGNLVYTWKK